LDHSIIGTTEREENNMNEMAKNAALVRMDEWNAIHDEMRKIFTVPENSMLSDEEFRTAAQQVQPLSSD
jgi:hypothetical protein